VSEALPDGSREHVRRKSYQFASDRLARYGPLATAFHRLARLVYGHKWAERGSAHVGCTASSIKGWACGTTSIPVEVAETVLARARKRVALVYEEHARAAEREEAELLAAIADFERLASPRR
jgi:hypothetical protein